MFNLYKIEFLFNCLPRKIEANLASLVLKTIIFILIFYTNTLYFKIFLWYSINRLCLLI